MNFCEYGCGNEANHQFKNGKWCCSTESTSCPGLKRKAVNNLRIKMKSQEVKQKISNSLKGKPSWSKGLTLKTDEEKRNTKEKYLNSKPKTFCILCNKETKHSKLCRSCSVKEGKKKWPIEYNNSDNKFCDLGCGQIAKYIFKNGTICCSTGGHLCPEIRKKE